MSEPLVPLIVKTTTSSVFQLVAYRNLPRGSVLTNSVLPPVVGVPALASAPVLASILNAETVLLTVFAT